MYLHLPVLQGKPGNRCRPSSEPFWKAELQSYSHLMTVHSCLKRIEPRKRGHHTKHCQLDRPKHFTYLVLRDTHKGPQRHPIQRDWLLQYRTMGCKTRVRLVRHIQRAKTCVRLRSQHAYLSHKHAAQHGHVLYARCDAMAPNRWSSCCPHYSNRLRMCLLSMLACLHWCQGITLPAFQSLQQCSLSKMTHLHRHVATLSDVYSFSKLASHS